MKRLVATSTVTCLALIVLQGSSIASASSSQVVSVVISPNLAVSISPKSVKHGTVVFKIGNHDSKPHEFSIDGRTSPEIAPHTVVKMNVTFDRAGVYSFSLPDATKAIETQPGAKAPGGTLKVA
jgi:Cupredoxin-like domain